MSLIRTPSPEIVLWEWSRSPQSPALGQVVGGSDHLPVLKLCDLIVVSCLVILHCRDFVELRIHIFDDIPFA